MNLEELVQSIPDEDAELRADLYCWIEKWKKDDATVNDLTHGIAALFDTNAIEWIAGRGQLFPDRWCR